MPVSEYKKPIELSPETQQWISDIDGKIRYATIKTIPSGNQKASHKMSPDFQNEYKMSLAYHKKGGMLNYLNYFN